MPSRTSTRVTAAEKAIVCTSTGAVRSARLTMCNPASPAATAARPRMPSAATSPLNPGRSSSASSVGCVTREASTVARPKLPVATSTVLRDRPSSEPMTARLCALPCSATWPTTPVATARPSSGFRFCCTSARSDSPSVSESVRSTRVPTMSSAMSNRPSPSLSRRPPLPSGSMKPGMTRLPSASSGRLVSVSEAKASAGIVVVWPVGALWPRAWATRLVTASYISSV